MNVADVLSIRFRNMPAIEIGPHDWLTLNEKIHEVAAQYTGLDGIVITHAR